MPFDDLAAILLVGGRSSRMGRPKPWLDLDGRPLLARMVDGVRRWTADVVLVAAAGQALPGLAGRAARVVHDVWPDQGPLPALALGLAAARAPWALVLGCDAPLVRGAVVDRLLAERAPGCDAVVPEWDGRLQPLVALYRTTLAPAIAELARAGERRLHVALVGRPGVRRLPAEMLRPLDPEGESFRPVNTPEEFAAAAARWRARRKRPG